MKWIPMWNDHLCLLPSNVAKPWPWAALVAQGKEPTCPAGNLGPSPASRRSPGEGMPTHSRILAWGIPGSGSLAGGLQSNGHDSANNAQALTLGFLRKFWLPDSPAHASRKPEYEDQLTASVRSWRRWSWSENRSDHDPPLIRAGSARAKHQARLKAGRHLPSALFVAEVHNSPPQAFSPGWVTPQGSVLSRFWHPQLWPAPCGSGWHPCGNRRGLPPALSSAPSHAALVESDF